MSCDLMVKRLLDLKAAGKEKTSEYLRLQYRVFYDVRQRRHLNTARCGK